MATVYGSKVNSVWRSYMTYTVTNTETTTTVKITAGMNIPNKYNTSRGMTSKISGTGHTTTSGSIAAKSRSGVGSWAIKTVTWSWTRGTSASTKTIKAVLSGSGESSTSTATATITVPARNKYIVSYDANGGEGSIANQSQYYENAVTLSNGTGLSRENYKLLGWKDSSGEGETVTYNFGDSFTVTSNKTMYAVWKLMNFKIKFDCNGGAFTNGTTYETAEMLAGTQYSLTNMPQQIPTRTGYTFLGWARQSSSTSATTYIDSTVAAEEGMIFYAVWTAEYIPMSYKQQDILARRMNRVTWISDDAGEAMELQLPFTYGRIVTCNARVSSHAIVKSNVTTGLTVTMERRTEGGTWQAQVNAQSFSGSPLFIQDGALYVLEEYYDIRVTIKDSYTSAHQLTGLVALTNITKATFVLDINSDGSAVSFFSTASDSEHKVVNVSGTVKTTDIQLGLDTNAGSGSDYEIYTALQTLGWTDCII